MRRQVRRNPAIASRHGVHAHLTSDHASRDDVREATALVRYVIAHPHPLGSGNFGVVHLTPGPMIVKLPARTNLYGVPWTTAQQRANLLHEAGVANELEALGYDVVPHTLFVELGDGTPALVREYGEPLSSMTIAEFETLEATLVDIEARSPWSVRDRIDLYRRRDGSIFIGDVGIWRTMRADDVSVLYVLLSSLFKKIFGKYVWAVPVLVENMERLRHDEENLRSLVQRNADEQRVSRLADDVASRARQIAFIVRERLNLGMRVPAGVLDAVDAAWDTLAELGNHDYHVSIGVWDGVRDADERTRG